METSLRKYFKSFTGLKKTVNKTLTDKLIAYSLQEHSKHLAYISERKWQHRQKGESYKQWEDPALKDIEATPNICKNQPKSMIKYINIQTALCPVCCKSRDQTKARCSLEHLKKFHNIHLESIHSVAQEVMELIEAEENKRKEDSKMTHQEILEYAEELIQPNLDKLKAFLNQRGSWMILIMYIR